MMTAIYRRFLRAHLGDGAADLPAIYHAVRNIPYGSVGERDPVKIIANNLGSCSGKHILLRDLLREIGREAQVLTLFTYFNRGIPSHPSMPESLRALIDGADVCDFHHYVGARGEHGWVKLDATWHDALIPYGFPVNHDWKGQGDTVLAAAPIREYQAVENLAAWKTELLAQLTPEQRELRTRFFRQLADWMMKL
jgi:hypothetical protein